MNPIKVIKEKIKSGHWPVFLISLTSAITNLLLPILLVRMLSPDSIGIYKLFFLYAQSIIFISLAGGPLYSVYYFIGKKENSLIYLEQAWILNFIVSFACAVLGFIFITPISSLISMSEKYTVLLILSAITSAPSSFYGEYLVASGSRIKGSLFNSGFDILKTIVILLCVYKTHDIHTAFWGFSILFVIKLIIAIYFSIKSKLLSFNINKKYMMEVIKYCSPMSIAGAMSFVVEKIDMIILSTRLEPIQFAFYSMGCLIVPPLLLLEMSIQKILIPNLSKAFHHDRFDEMIIYYRQAQSDISYIMIPAVFGLILYNRPIIELLFTAQYLDSAIYLQIYAFTYLTYIIPHDSIPRATGNTKWVLKMYMLLTPISISVVYFVAGKYGAKGALISSIVFMYFPKIPGLFFSAKITKTTIIKLIAWRAHLFYILVNLFLMLCSLKLRYFFDTDKKWFFITAPIYTLSYFAIVLSVKYVKNKKELNHGV